jgi:hypothetical protein
MPLLEVNHIRHINASVRLDEFTTAQVDQYAAFTQPQTMLWTKRSPVSSRRTATSDILRKRHRLSSCFYIACAYGASNGASEEPAKKSVAGVESTGSTQVLNV